MIITLQEFKDLNGITTTDKDAVISALIPLIEEDYLRIRNKPFDEEYNEDTQEWGVVYPLGSKLTAAAMIEYRMNAGKTSGVQSESLGKYSITYQTGGGANGYPASITGSIKRYVSFA